MNRLWDWNGAGFNLLEELMSLDWNGAVLKLELMSIFFNKQELMSLVSSEKCEPFAVLVGDTVHLEDWEVSRIELMSILWTLGNCGLIIWWIKD